MQTKEAAMNYKELDKLRALRDVFDKNYRITNLYAMLLERFPEIITSEMIDTLTEDGEIGQEEAIVALLTEIFGLKWHDPTDRELIRRYLTPSVRLLDADKYRSNPYYVNIHIDNIKDGAWELKRECYAPYRAVIAHDMTIEDDFTEIPPLGFFTERFEFPAVLEGGNEWMTLTPVDLDTCDEAIEAAHGRVVTFGLGLGYYAYMVSEKEGVDSVTIVEKSREVIRLFEKHILPQFPHKGKIRIVEADAFEYAEHVMPTERYDVAFVDTWRDASDGAPMYERMHALEHLSKGTVFLYWIKNFLISRLRAIKFEELLERAERGDEYPRTYGDVVDELKKI